MAGNSHTELIEQNEEYIQKTRPNDCFVFQSSTWTQLYNAQTL